MEYEYYFNKLPGERPWRNNLIYTSLISKDKKTFCQWYYNDVVYHENQNQVVLPELMEEKWQRELKYMKLMNGAYPDLVPKILDIDEKNRKLYLQIDGVDFWQRHNDLGKTFYDVLPDWDEQILNIVKQHKSLGLHKYSMHPSSFFMIDGVLKSINYFFCYHKTEDSFSFKDVESHIYITRQEEVKNNLGKMGYAWEQKLPFTEIDKVCWNSFRNNYPNEFVDRVLNEAL